MKRGRRVDQTPTPPARLAQQRRRLNFVLPERPDFGPGLSASDSTADHDHPVLGAVQYSDTDVNADGTDTSHPLRGQLNFDDTDHSVPLDPEPRAPRHPRVPPGQNDNHDASDNISESAVLAVPDALDFGSSSDQAAPASFASTFVVATSRPKCNSIVNTKRREQYAQRILLKKAKTSGRDDLLHKALATPVGQRQMPRCAGAFGNSAHFASLVENTKKLLKHTGRRHKHEMAHMLCEGLPKWFSKSKLGLTHAQTKRAQEEIQSLGAGRTLDAACYAENVNRNKIPESMSNIFMQFFHRSTYQCSGADQDKARIMDMEFFEWEAELTALWPGLLREEAARMPDQVRVLSDMPEGGWTDYQACMLSAVEQKTQNAAEEQDQRRTKYLVAYRLELARTRGELSPKTNAENAADAQTRKDRLTARLRPEDFDPSTYTIKAPTLKTFRLWLGKQQLRFTRFSVPHPCPLCTSGPTDEVVYKELSKQMEDLVTAGLPVPKELQQRCTKLRKALRIYRVHIRQLTTARAEAKQAEDDLLPGTCMVIRDFVNHHDHSGKHVKCLHWVLMWRDKIGEPIKRLKLRHYCSNMGSMNTDSYYQADITDFHLNEENPHCPLLFKDFHTIIFVGDHGPHFSSHETMHNESTLLRRFGKTLILMFLASYHAYSRADASGAEDSSGLRRDLRAGLPRVGAIAMKDMTNNSNDNRSWAYEFPAINRNTTVFPAAKHFQAKDRAKWIKKWCEVKFTHPDNTAQYDGILQYRLVTGEGPWQWTDLIAAKRTDAEAMCDKCSTISDAVVLHTAASCPAPSYIHDLPEYKDLQPDPSRISGEQVANRKKKQAGKAGKVTYPCKVLLCDHNTNKRKAFRKASTANRHMRIEHKMSDADFESAGYPDADKPAPAAKPGPRRKAPRIPARVSDNPGSDPASAGASGEAAGDEDDESEPDHGDSQEGSCNDQAAGTDSPDESVHTDAEESAADDDPDEEVNIGATQYVVKDVLTHRLLDNGTTKYRIAWEGTAVTTWEPETSLNHQMRADYHAKVDEASRAAAAAAAAREAAADAAILAGGGRLRARRSRPTNTNRAERREKVKQTADAYIAAGMLYYNAWEKAEGEVPL